MPGEISPAASNEQTLGDYAERGRTIEISTASFTANQVYTSTIVKWASIQPVLSVEVPTPIPGADANAGNPFLWYEVSYEYHLIRSDGASPGIVGGMILIDSIEMPTVPTSAPALKDFQGTNGEFFNGGLQGTTTYRAAPGVHVIRPQIFITTSSTLNCTITFRNFKIEGGVL